MGEVRALVRRGEWEGGGAGTRAEEERVSVMARTSMLVTLPTFQFLMSPLKA